LKNIYNWKRATVADLESDNLLDLATKLHVLGFQMDNKDIITFRGSSESERIVKFFQWHIDNETPIVMHNGVSFDVPLMEKLFGVDLSKLMLIDTLALSWYLNTERKAHGLGTFHEDYGIEKPPVDDWSEQPYEVYQNRVVEDVKINQALWKDLKTRLIGLYTSAKVEIDSGSVGGKRISDNEVLAIDELKGLSVEEHINRLLTFLMFKMDCARLQEKTRWEVDTQLLYESEAKLEAIVNETTEALEAVMPKVPQYVKKEAPKKPFKKDGSLSSIGLKWNELMEVYKNKEVDELDTLKVESTELKCVFKVLNGYEEPKASSPAQVKALLYSHGWVPTSFRYEKDEDAFNAWIDRKPKEGSHHSKWGEWKDSKPEERAIPQISVGGDGGKELCESVLELAEDVPAIRRYAEYNVAKHRLGVIKGFIRDLKDGKWLQARIGGFTNTLRVMHREIVNLPGVDKPHGELIRGVLVAGEGKTSVGSDLSSLEDRTKHHFMLPYDPEYVATMQEDDFDPHILMALTAKMVTQKEYDDFKKGEKSANAKAARKKGKTCLPVDNTEVLTSKGWKVGKDVCIGEEVLSLDNISGRMEFCKVVDTVSFKDSKTVTMKNSNWELESTEDHRWVVDRVTGRAHTRRKVREYIETKDLNKACNLVTTGEYVGGKSAVTQDQARLVAWVLSDGHLDASALTGKTSQGTDGRRQAVKMSIAQSKAKYFDEVKETLDSVGLSYGVSVNNSGVEVFTIAQADARKFLNDVGLPIKNKHDIDYTEWLMGLSKSCLEGFFDAFWKADGNTAKSGTTYATKIIYQNSGNIANAVHLCSHLLGKTTLNDTAKGFGTVRSQNRSTVTMQKVTKAHSRVVDTFCLTTENSNFVIRQNGFITVTGNCNYASVYNAGAAKIAQAAGVSLKEGKILHEAYWKLNWSVKAIADEQVVIKDYRCRKWLVNPVNGFCYALRSEADRFSTLAQGTGSYFFDMWVDNILEEQQNKYKKKTLTGEFHDENIFVIKDLPKYKEEFKEIIHSSIDKVNVYYKLRRKLGCDTQYGQRYSDIH
jgi:hypothetical protein